MSPHRLLCTALVDDEAHPLITFKVNAMHTNPMFLTAARMVSLVLAEPSKYVLKYDNFQGDEWHKAVPCPTDESDPEGFASELCELASDMASQLVEAILLPKERRNDVIHACSMFSTYLGILEQNQFEISLDDEDDACGAGIFSLCCCANHSCVPNAEIVFISGTNEATVRAITDIAPGEEICVSYIDTDLGLEERREELFDYGFLCKCPRCIQEDIWMAKQNELAKYVIYDRCEPADLKVTRVGGFDISFPENEQTDDSIACFVVLSYPELEVVYEQCLPVKMAEPYIPGFLAFREAPICQKMLELVPVDKRPDVLLLDGSGVLHPRCCGLASHIGVLCNIPTIGVSKKVLGVDGMTRDSVKELCKKKLKNGLREIDLKGDSGRLWGRALISPGAQNPVFVSVGHRLDLETAVNIVRVTCAKTRVPAPIRHADLSSREAIRQRKNGTQLASASSSAFSILGEL